MRTISAIAAAGCVLLSACNPLEPLCENRVASATANTSRANYRSGHTAGVAAALACIDREGGKSDVAVEKCKRVLR